LEKGKPVTLKGKKKNSGSQQGSGEGLNKLKKRERGRGGSQRSGNSLISGPKREKKRIWGNRL